MAKIISVAQIADHINKRKGELTKVEFAEQTGITRQALVAITKGLYNPKSRVLKALGLELCYKVLDETPMKSTKPKPVEKGLTLEQENRLLKKLVKDLQKQPAAAKPKK